MTIPILYTPEEISEKLKVTRRSVYEWLLKGRLRGLRAGDTWRISEADLMAFLESRKAPAPRVGPKHPDYERWLAYFQRQPVKGGKGRKK
jgi:excisionase family DNA binding protein